MSRKFYAGYNSYGTNFVFNASNGWSVHVFTSKQKRDAWVNDDQYPRGNASREAITRKNAEKITHQDNWKWE